MPRASGIKQLLSPSQGLVTEQSKLTPVEGSTISEDNFTFNDDGSVRRRRLGVNLEEDSSFFTLDCSVSSSVATSYTLWEGVAGIGGENWHVFQIGKCLHFFRDVSGNIYGNNKNFTFDLGLQASNGYKVTGTHTAGNDASALTDGTKSWTVDEWVGYTVYNTTDGSSGVITANTATTVTATLTGGTDNDFDTGDAYIISKVEDEPVDMISGEGYLFIVGKKLEPFYLEHDTAGDTISSTNINIQVRDLTGIDDSLEVDERPATLSEEHEYNLKNQGWWQQRKRISDGSLVDPITQFDTDIGDFPSNADISHLGMVDDGSGNLRFKSTFLEELTLGNTPAPKGHFIIDPFCIAYDDLRTGTATGGGGYGTFSGNVGGAYGGAPVTTPPPWYQPPLYESEN